MSTTIKWFYWITFILSAFILQLNVGLGLVALAIVIIPIIAFHIIVGLSLHLLEKHRILILFSITNLLLFALIRADGVHVISDNGLSSLLYLFGINGGYSEAHEMEFFIATVVLALVQLGVEIKLVLFRLSVRQQKNSGKREQIE